jgi:hypothetical protein
MTTIAPTSWESRMREILPLFGHRNWIVVADAAYPAQSRAGIETIVAGADQVHVLRKVVDAIAGSSHIRANTYLDRELEFVSEQDAPGIASYKRELGLLLADSNVSRLPHEEIICKLDQSAQLFSILIIKTDLTIPYTSVFFELDCGYWDAAAEQRLRQEIWEPEALQGQSPCETS